jgi:hypothetical protein
VSPPLLRADGSLNLDVVIASRRAYSYTILPTCHDQQTVCHFKVEESVGTALRRLDKARDHS